MEKELENVLRLMLDKLDHLEQGQSLLQEDVTKIKMTLESTVQPSIQLLAEGFQGYADRVPKMDQMAGDLVAVKEDVSIIKDAVTAHSEELRDHERVIGQLKAIQ